MKCKKYFELVPEDFPEGEPVLKMKHGLWYRDNNSGYTDCITKAGLYDREEALKYCFNEKGQNGRYDVLAVPVRAALRGYTTGYFAEQMQKIKDLMIYAEQSEEIKIVVF